ncbi:permease of the major facilitator superfamily [Solibacillus silvestris StLB046]|uniref:Permease of the major facilitator superfamily n=1 Tax=Solibacillus silvestris (strain StLB046) TaxID=1002809 RepID=F2F8B5_SOLSS|nr:MFS transporter [Solibacillus silvestris]BAK17919.1 permease of the major facilitator superfamily [Solibacillus silvestris StLB046]
MKEIKEPIWTKDFIIVSIINFVSILMFFLLMVTISSYAVDTYHVSTSIAGLVSSIFIIGSLIGRLGAGRLIGNIGPQKMLLIGLVLFFVTTTLYLMEWGVVYLLIIRLLQGIAVGTIGTATGTIVAMILPISRKGEGIGYFSLSAVLATAIGPFVGMFMLKLENGFDVIFYMNTGLSLMLLIAYFFVKISLPPVNKQNGQQTEKLSFIEKFIEPKALPISFIALLIGFAYSGVMTFITFYAREINLVEAASYFFLAYAGIVIISRPFTGKLMDVRRPNVIVYPCLAVFAVGMLLFSQASAGWMLLVAAVLIGFGYGNFNSIAQTIAVKVTEPHRFGLATSTYFILYDLGLGVGPFILGMIEPHTTYRTIFVSMIPLILICIPLYYLLVGRKQRLA